MLAKTGVMRPQPEHANLTVLPRLLMPKYMYNKEIYPDYVSGAITVFPFGTVECLYASSFRIPYFPINDAFLGFAGEACGYKFVHENHIHAGNDTELEPVNVPKWRRQKKVLTYKGNAIRKVHTCTKP